MTTTTTPQHTPTDRRLACSPPPPTTPRRRRPCRPPAAPQLLLRQAVPCEEAPLEPPPRDHITGERAAQDQLAADHGELGHRDQEERAYGRVEALDGLLATMDRMDRMEAGQ